MTIVFGKVLDAGGKREVQCRRESVCEKDTLADLVAEMDAEDGVPRPEAYSWADAVLKQDSSDDADAA